MKAAADKGDIPSIRTLLLTRSDGRTTGHSHCRCRSATRVLHDLSLMAVDLQALAQQVLGGFILVSCFQRTGALIQSGRLVSDGGAVYRFHSGQSGRPLHDGQADISLPFVHAAEVDVGRHEIRIQGDRAGQTVAGRIEVTSIRQHHGVVEEDRKEHRMVRIVSDPRFIQSLHGRRLAALFERLGGVHQIGHAQIAGHRLDHGR